MKTIGQRKAYEHLSLYHALPLLMVNRSFDEVPSSETSFVAAISACEHVRGPWTVALALLAMAEDEECAGRGEVRWRIKRMEKMCLKKRTKNPLKNETKKA